MISLERLDELRSEYDECFACGAANPIGLQLSGFAVAGSEVQASWTPRAEYRGFEATLHGGIVAVALDEICAWAAIYFEGVLAVTANLELKYRAPAPPSTELTLAGWVEERSGSRLRLAGELRQGDRVLAGGRGLYLARSIDA